MHTQINLADTTELPRHYNRGNLSFDLGNTIRGKSVLTESLCVQAGFK